jgi:peptidoglycan hydrolase CwlO-like protein
MDETKVMLTKILEAVQVLDAKVESNTLEIARLNGKIDSLEKKVDGLDERLTSLESKVSSIETTMIQRFDSFNDGQLLLLERTFQNEKDIRRLQRTK